MKVIVYVTPVMRSRVICEALLHGIARCGDEAVMRDERAHTIVVADGDAAAFYSLYGCLQQVMADYRAAGRAAVFLDLGYWHRKSKGAGMYTGYHRCSINERHALSTFQRRHHDATRFDALDVPIRFGHAPSRGHVVLCGMQEKAAAVYGLAAHEWEEQAVAEIKRHTDREIVYRPKPSWDAARPIAGTTFSHRRCEIDADLAGAWAVVTHHSNAAIDGLVAGVPPFGLEDGLAKVLSRPICMVEGAYNMPVDDAARVQFLYDVAWAQWNVDEMRSGAMWRYLKEEGLA